jgi:alkaline phosphatase D
VVFLRKSMPIRMYRFLLLFFGVSLISACNSKENSPSGQDGAADDPVALFAGQELPTDQTLTTIAIGSCNRQDAPQEMWPFIQAQDPDLWIWMGDNIYGDSEDMAVMADKYRVQKFGEAYTSFREQVPVIGIWDDHDYGVNDGGKEYPKKDASKALMMDFLDVPRDAAVRQRPGTYQSYLFGYNDQQVKVILLDTRYFRDSLKRATDGKRRYVANDEGDMLGEAQWAWLEEQLTNSEAEVHIIASSVQVLSEEHGYEKWANLPRSRQRFFDLLERTQPYRTILLSGDRHISELARIDLEGLDYPLFELTSSGMTHTWGSVGEEPNKYRQGNIIAKLAYGLIKIDWSGPEPKIQLEVNGLENANYLDIDLPL